MLKTQTLLLPEAVGPRTSVLTNTALDVFLQLCQMELIPDRHAAWTCQRGIHATMDIAGDESMLLLVALPEEVAAEMAHRLTGYDIHFDSRDMINAMQDLTLILGGHLRNRLRNKGTEITLSAPTVQRCDCDTLPAPYRYLKKVTLSSHSGPVLVAILEQ